MKEYKVICVQDNTGGKGLNGIIEELTIQINKYLNNGAILNGGIAISNCEGCYTVSQSITITRYPPPDGDEKDW
jgi:hypothetical protein